MKVNFNRVGISMGTKCDSLLGVLFYYSYKVGSSQEQLKENSTILQFHVLLYR